jgi:3-hydroxyisobutyrate dehydrogenase-like beta-hydroxyacid dehydrogenase
MGGAIATRIIHGGWPTILWARRPSALHEFRGANVEAAGTPAELATAADVIGICVWSDDDVREVVAGEQGVLAGCRPGTVIAVHSTVLPSTVRDLAALAAKTGVFVVDAPVSGGRKVALAGFLTLAVGGDERALVRCRPVFDAFAGEIVRLGDVGAGQVAKLLNNMLFAANLAVADDALTLGEAMGVDAGALAKFLGAGSGRSFGLGIAQTARGSDATRQAALPALQKDVDRLTIEAALHGIEGTSLRVAAVEALRRLRDPPLGWR